MSEALPETLEFGPPGPDSKHRRRVVDVVVAAVVVVAGTALVGSQAGWFDNEADTHPAIAHPVPSNPRALTAALLMHIPDSVTVVWSSASGDLSDATPGIGPAATQRKTLISSVLMRVGSEEFFLAVVTGPGNQAVVPDVLGNGLITRDRASRTINEMLGGSANGSPILITESASPSSRADLPLSDADLKAILADPLVGLQTDAATIAQSRNLSSYTESPPPLTWEP